MFWSEVGHLRSRTLKAVIVGSDMVCRDREHYNLVNRTCSTTCLPAVAMSRNHARVHLPHIVDRGGDVSEQLGNPVRDTGQAGKVGKYRNTCHVNDIPRGGVGSSCFLHSQGAP